MFFSRALLATPHGIIEDPHNLEGGWISERDHGISLWPPVYINDISEYLMLTHPDKGDFRQRLLNEYKEGKAYR